MPAKPAKKAGATPREYIVVADRTSRVLLSVESYVTAVRYAGVIRRGGGEVTIFRSTKG
jgi:hypothetical protein